MQARDMYEMREADVRRVRSPHRASARRRVSSARASALLRLELTKRRAHERLNVGRNRSVVNRALAERERSPQRLALAPAMRAGGDVALHLGALLLADFAFEVAREHRDNVGASVGAR